MDEISRQRFLTCYKQHMKYALTLPKQHFLSNSKLCHYSVFTSVYHRKLSPTLYA